MKYKKKIANQSKAKRVYIIFRTNPCALFNSGEITQNFNAFFDDEIKLEAVSIILTRLFRSNKIIRTPSQTAKGYVYTLQNKNKLNNIYQNHLLPHDFDDAPHLLKLINIENFDDLRTDAVIGNIRKLRFFRKYGMNHFNDECTMLFLAKAVSFIMGDGHIKKDEESVYFFFKEKSDAELFKIDFLQCFKLEKMNVIKRKGCYASIISSKPFSELLQKLGAPKGNKVFQSFSIPDWIYHGSDYIKLAFLAVIYGNEGSKPQDNRWRIQFVLSKNKDNVENLLIFLNQIRNMLNYFGISSTFIQLRKQNRRQFCGRFYIKGKCNLHKFYKLLEFSYASEKQRVLESLILKGRSF